MSPQCRTAETVPNHFCTEHSSLHIIGVITDICRCRAMRCGDKLLLLTTIASTSQSAQYVCWHVQATFENVSSVQLSLLDATNASASPDVYGAKQILLLFRKYLLSQYRPTQHDLLTSAIAVTCYTFIT